jgi:hypothetical protein
MKPRRALDKQLFSVEIKLPSGKRKRIQELNNRQYLTIIKYCENEDYRGLSLFFDDLYLSKDLDIFDRLYTLIYVRMIFVNESLSFNTKENREVDISLSTVLDKLEQNYTNLNKRVEHDNIVIDLGLPTCSYFETIEDIFNNVIQKITINNESIDFTSLSDIDKKAILDNLPTTIFKKLKAYIDSLSENLLDIEVIESNETLGISEIKLSIIGNGVMQFIAMIYGNNLRSFYEFIYAFYAHITNGSDVFFDISPVESKILLNIHNKRIQDENKELKKQNSQ